MKLILQLAEQDGAPGQSRTLEQGRLSIGRGSDNDWVLPDPDRTLSKNHCRIDASEGGFMLTDLSTNGVFLAGAQQAIGRGHSCALENGDSFSMGPYRMFAEVQDEEALGLEHGLGLPFEDDGDGFASVSPIAQAVSEPWLDGIPGGEFGPGRRAASQGWEAPPDPAAYAASGVFERADPRAPQPGNGGAFHADSELFAQNSEHIAASSTVMRLPETQVVLPMDWMDSDPLEPPHEEQDAAATAAWPPALPQEPDPEPPAAPLPPEWSVAPPAMPALPAQPPPAQTARPLPRPEATPLPTAARPQETRQAPRRPPSRAAAPLPAAPPPAPPAPPAAAGDVAALAIAAFLDGAGLPRDTLDAADPEDAMRAIGEMVRVAVEGVRDILSTRALVKSEFRVDQTVMRRSDNNALKWAPDAQRCMAAMVGTPPLGFLPGAAAMQQSMDDIKLHELALVAALNSVFAELGNQLDPETIAAKARQDGGLGTMLPYAREAKCWALYVETYRMVQDSGAANTGGSLLAPLAQAYARQLRRGG